MAAKHNTASRGMCDIRVVSRRRAAFSQSNATYRRSGPLPHICVSAFYGEGRRTLIGQCQGSFWNIHFYGAVSRKCSHLISKGEVFPWCRFPVFNRCSRLSSGSIQLPLIFFHCIIVASLLVFWAKD